MGVSHTLRLAALALVVASWGCDKGEGPKPDPARAGSAAPSASAAPVKLDGIDTASLTAREREQWSDLVTELYAPCKEVAVPLAQCVAQKRACKTCKPAAEFLLREVQAGLPRAEIVSAYEARFMPDKVKAIVIGDSPVRGPSDAPITLIEYADFECPSCGNAYPILEELYAKYDGRVRMVFKNFPLPAHPNAKLAAEAGYAALRQGQFWRMHHVLFENQERLSGPDLMSYAEKVGLDLGKFKADMRSDEAKQRVEQEQKQGDELGVNATPTIYINGRECDLSKLGNPLKELELWIQLELELAGASVAPASSTAVPVASAAPAASAAPSAAPKGSATPRGSAPKGPAH